MDREVMRLKSLADSLSLLKKMEMGEARRHAAMRDRCIEVAAKKFLAGCVTAYVGDARKWARAQVNAQRELRRHMLDRRLAKFVDSVPVDKWVLTARGHR